MIAYEVHHSGAGLDLDEVIGLYRASTLGERRPVDDRGRMRRMLDHANLIVTARDGGLLVGFSRALSDFSFATYLSDLAVHVSYQRQGIGREMIRQTQLAGAPAKVILLAAPAAVDYYPRIGMTPHHSCWTLDPDQELR